MKNSNGKGNVFSDKACLVDADREVMLHTLDKVCQSMAVLACTVDRLKFELETSHGKQKQALNALGISDRLH